MTAYAEQPGSLIHLDVEKYKLKNGLTVLLHVDRSAPIVSHHVWFRVGSRDEEPGYTGIAHLFEHMMFKGAKKYTGKQYNLLLEQNGASFNAFTSYDYTGYYVNLPSDKLDLVMDMESDRFKDLIIAKSHLDSEREVVKEERRVRVDNSVFGALREALYATAFKVHPYRWPIIGWMKDVNRIDEEKSKEFFGKFYSPNNAVLSIAGNFEKEEVKKLIEKYYGGWRKEENLTRVKYPQEPEQKGYRFQKIKRSVQSKTFSVAYPSTRAGSEDAYALDLLANILGEGQSSRLYKDLVYSEQLATGVSAYNYTPKDPGLFQIYVSLKPGASFEKARKSTLGQIFKLRNTLVKEKELQKAKNQVMKSYVDSIKTIGGKAYLLALNETLFSDYKEIFKDLDKYSQVTVEDIRTVAKKYLKVNQANVVLVEPSQR